MTRDRGPEEFFEVFREVQAGKKRAQEGPAPERAPAEASGAEPAEPRGGGAPQTFEVTYPVAAAFVVGAVLLIVAAYLLGKQQGWRAHAAALSRPAARQGPRPATGGPGSPAALDAGPELVDGRVFTLIMYGRSQRLAQLEADYLNREARFQALRVQAYVYRDRSGAYRLCVRGLARRTPAEREAVKAELRRLKSSAKKLDYRDADFQAP